jgi:hypothetical protein
MGLGKPIEYQAVLALNNIGDPIDSDLFYDDFGSTMEFSNACGCEYKSGVDAQTVQAGLGALGQVAGAVTSVSAKGRKDVKQVCPKKPLVRLTKAQKEAGKAYDACVKKYMAGTLPKKGAETKDGTMPVIEVKNTTDKKDNTLIYVGVGIGVLALVVGAYLITKKK